MSSQCQEAVDTAGPSSSYAREGEEESRGGRNDLCCVHTCCVYVSEEYGRKLRRLTQTVEVYAL